MVATRRAASSASSSPRRGEGWGEGVRTYREILNPSPGSLCDPTSPLRGEVKARGPLVRIIDPLTLCKLVPHDRGAFDHGAHLAKGNLAREIFHAAVGRDHDPLGRNERERRADVRGHRLRALN